MKKRDFTDERKRSSIPTMRRDQDPASPFCSDLSLLSRGPVAQMHLPPGWIFGEKQDSGARRYSFQNLHPAGNESAMVSFFYRGFQIDEQSAVSFKRILAEEVHDLTFAELESIREVIQDRADPQFFDLKLVRTKTLNNKRILVIEGFYKHCPEGRLELFVPADSEGRIIQEIFYQAPIVSYPQFRPAACKAFDSIVWKPY